MIKKLFQNQAVKVGTGFWLLNRDNISLLFFYLLILFLPTQFGKHFWPQFSIVYGLRLDYLSPTIYFTDVLIILIVVFSLKSIIDFIQKIEIKYLIFYLLFIICLLLPIPFSKNPLAGIYGILKLNEFFLLFIYIVSRFKEFNKKIIFYFLSIGIIFESLLSLLQYINKGSLGGILYFLGERTFSAQTPGIANASVNGQLFLRAYGTFSHPNVLAGYLITAIILILFVAQKEKINKKIISSVILIGSISLIFTLSRVVLILWAFFLLFLFGVSIAKKYKKTISNSQVVQIVIFFIFIVVVALSLFQTTPLFGRFFSTTLSEESVTQREDLLSQSLSMFSKNPLLGVGVNNFYNNLSFNTGQNKQTLIQPVHNIFILILAETGIVGITFFIYLLYKLTPIKLIKNKAINKYLAMLFLSVIFIGLFDHYFLTLQQGQILLCIIFATLSAQKYS